jgi:hypothetical protein
MVDTAHLDLPLLEASQAQKHVTVNEALVRMDALISLAVLSRSLSTPPSSPLEGDRYIVGSSGTGDWTGEDDTVAVYLNGTWVFLEPHAGWVAWVEDESATVLYTHQWTRQTLARSPSIALTTCDIAEEDVTLSGATTDSTAIIPDRAVVIGVTARVITAITGATSFDIGVAGATNRYGSGIGVALNSESNGVTGSPVAYYSDTALRLTANGSDFTGGEVRLAVHYMQLTPPALV